MPVTIGLIAVICVAVGGGMGWMATVWPPKLTANALARFVPLIVTSVPPTGRPRRRRDAVTVGAAR